MHSIPLTEPEQAIGSNEKFVSHPARNERGESRREGKEASSPRPSPPSAGGEGEEIVRRNHKGAVA